MADVLEQILPDGLNTESRLRTEIGKHGFSVDSVYGKHYTRRPPDGANSACLNERSVRVDGRCIELMRIVTAPDRLSREPVERNPNKPAMAKLMASADMLDVHQLWEEIAPVFKRRFLANLGLEVLGGEVAYHWYDAPLRHRSPRWEDVRRELQALQTAWEDTDFIAPSAQCLRDLDLVLTILPTRARMPDIEVHDDTGRLTLSWRRDGVEGFVVIDLPGNDTAICVARTHRDVAEQFELDGAGERQMANLLSAPDLLERLV